MILWSLLLAMTIGNYARVSEVEGDVVVEREGEYHPLTLNFLVEPGDRILAIDGRAELEFRYRTVVWIGKDADFLVHRIERDLREFELRDGKITVWNQKKGEVRIVLPQGEIDLRPRSRVRIHIREDGDVWVSVLDGRIYVDTDEMSLVAEEGEELEIDRYGELTYRSFPWDDDFDSWCDHRYVRYTVHFSVIYWEPVVWVGFWDLAPYGEWVWIPPYGWVWVPHVTIGWQPYLYGYWTYRPGFGWVWVSYEPWGWIPYHYGRWAYIPGRGWVWVPGRTFSGGWVAWYVDGSTVAWAPLGPYDQVVQGPGHRSTWVAVTRKSFEHPTPSLLTGKGGASKRLPYQPVTLKRPIRNWTRQPRLTVPKVELPTHLQEKVKRVALEKGRFPKSRFSNRLPKPKEERKTAWRPADTFGKSAQKNPGRSRETFEKPTAPPLEQPGKKSSHSPSPRLRPRHTPKLHPEERTPKKFQRSFPDDEEKKNHSRPPRRDKDSPSWFQSMRSLGERVVGMWRSRQQTQDSKKARKHTSRPRRPVDSRKGLKDNR